MLWENISAPFEECNLLLGDEQGFLSNKAEMKRRKGMKRIVFALFLVAFVASPVFAGFINGGFEDSTPFNGWTKGGSYPNDSAIVGIGTDPNTLGNLNMVSAGSYAARVGNAANGYHSSSIAQTVTNWQDDRIWFAWAAVLEEPSQYNPPHSQTQMADYIVKLYDQTTSTVLFEQAYNVLTIPSTGWHTGANSGNGTWHYSNWYAENLPTSAVKGHDLTLTFTATDCSLGGHGGYMYVDQVGSTPPVISTPEPGTLLLLGFGFVGLAGLRRKSKRQ